MALRFYKAEGTRNDFVIVLESDLAAAGITGARKPSFAEVVCDRHRGIGGDGMLVLAREGADLVMEVWNADGSLAQMCGNGVRCVALLAADLWPEMGSAFTVKTMSGPHRCEVTDKDGPLGRIAVEMRVPQFLAAQIPVEPALLGVAADSRLVDAEVQLAPDLSVRLTAVSMGNPHAVIFDWAEGREEQIAQLLQASKAFSASVNVGFARLNNDHEMDLRVFERGVGWTEACGTGACAAVAAAALTGRVAYGSDVNVRLPGGWLSIRVEAEGRPARMEGDARIIFRGETMDLEDAIS